MRGPPECNLFFYCNIIITIMPVRVEIKNFMDQQLRILAPWTRDISACQVFLEIDFPKDLP